MPGSIPNSAVSWENLLDCLDEKWASVCSSDEEQGSGLNENARRFLEEKFFGTGFYCLKILNKVHVLMKQKIKFYSNESLLQQTIYSIN